MLTDTGPIVALINRKDPNHKTCVEAVKRFPALPLLTTWPCFTEAMHILHRMGGHRAQLLLWRLRETGRLNLHINSEPELAQMAAMMAKYHDLPMDLADASMIAAAEAIGFTRVFTLDRDFHVYRFSDGSAVEVVP